MPRLEAKIVITGDEVREKAIAGAKIAYEAVASAYSPTSGNVALQKNFGSKVITHDGVSIIREIGLEDELMDTGVDLLNSASKKTNDTSGDGTSATVILGYHIMRLANQRISAGYNPMGLRRGIDQASLLIKDEIEKLAKAVPDEQLSQVATISASDPEVGKLVADTVIRVGGVGITVEEYDGMGVIQDVVEGVYFEKGFSAPHFVTDQETEEVIHENVNVLILEKRITTNPDIVPLLELINKCDSKKVIIIGNVSNQALNTCIATHLHPKSALDVVVVQPPVYGDQVLPFLKDIGAMTGAKVVPQSMSSDKVTADYIGKADKIIVTTTNTTLLGANIDQEEVDARIKVLKEQLKSDKFSPFQKERMEMRLAKLQGKIGIIKVGGATETGRKEMKFRVEDALHATRCAKEEGIVPGGATLLARLSQAVIALDDETEREGAKAVLEALREPFKQLMSNCGEDGGYRLMQVLNSEYGEGFDVKNMTKEPINLVDKGIIDPAKVIKSVVENACEVAGIAITLNASITIDREWQLQQIKLNEAR
jgi:chaperonin GroEL